MWQSFACLISSGFFYTYYILCWLTKKYSFPWGTKLAESNGLVSPLLTTREAAWLQSCSIWSMAAECTAIFQFCSWNNDHDLLWQASAVHIWAFLGHLNSKTKPGKTSEGSEEGHDHAQALSPEPLLLLLQGCSKSSGWLLGSTWPVEAATQLYTTVNRRMSWFSFQLQSPSLCRVCTVLKSCYNIGPKMQQPRGISKNSKNILQPWPTHSNLEKSSVVSQSWTQPSATRGTACSSVQIRACSPPTQSVAYLFLPGPHRCNCSHRML